MSRVVRFGAVIVAAIVLTHTAAAQGHLQLDSKEVLRDNNYWSFLSNVFSRIYRDDVVLSVLRIPEHVPEEAAGILRTQNGYQVFSVTPSASVFLTENHSIFQHFDEHGREIPWKPADNIKQGLPTSYRNIKTQLQARPVSGDVAERIKHLWQLKLLEALNAHELDESELILGGASGICLYSMPLQGHGRVTAHGKLMYKNTPVWLLGEFSEALSLYAKGKISEKTLTKELRRVETK